MNIDEEKMWEAYSAQLDEIAEQNKRRNIEVLNLKCSLLKPLLTTDKTKISNQIKTLKQEMKSNTPYGDKTVYEEIIGILKRAQVA
ncbi:hypothetical protein [Anaerovorax odorimutans]|uniref:hypothetical protein n=1 Tax=Anaerovorax odorimutans TaxID=109327 RepID=UPI00041791B0|nr:hypothetical protein [Anaerovorax odorimutans]